MARHTRRIASAALLLIIFLAVLAAPVHAQLGATIMGVLTDSSGAAVPNATLSLTNQDTAVMLSSTKSDTNGDFSFLAVPAPGTYTIAVQVAGFSRFEQKNIVVTQGERRSVGTLALVVGSAAEAVTVHAEVTPVQTASAERSGDLDKHEISALLARGLNFAGLLRSLPGVSGGVDPTSPAGNSGQAYAALNGARASISLPTLDGVNATDPSSQGQLYGAPAIDTLSEINVKTSNYQAEYGGSAGGNVNLTTRSGSREFHGDVYTYFRNEALNANSFFNNKNKAIKPRYRYVTGGGSVGGPLYIPGKFNTGKNRVFFFFNDQYSYNGNPGSLQQITMPTALERAGNFSKSLTVGGVLIPVYQPGTQPIGTSNYYSLQTQANRRFSHGLEFKTNFTWSKSMDYSSSDLGIFPLYASRKVLSYDLSSFDRPYIANLAWLYEIPFGKHMKNPVAKTALGDWNVSGTLTFASGAPQGMGFSTTTGVDLIGGGDGQRINVSGNPNLPRGTRNGTAWFDKSVFSLPAMNYIGSASRYVFRGPGQNQWDLSVFKDIAVKEKATVQFRGEFYNALNHTQWSGINASPQFNPATGAQTNALFGQATSDRGPRVIQLALRVSF